MVCGASGFSTIGGVAHADSGGVASGRSAKVEAVLRELAAGSDKSAASKPPAAVERATREARGALQRARQLEARGDLRSAEAANQLALEWAECGRDELTAARREQAAAAAEQAVAEAQQQVRRAEAFLEETEARRGRARAQLDAINAGSQRRAPAPAPAPSGTSTPSPAAQTVGD